MTSWAWDPRPINAEHMKNIFVKKNSEDGHHIQPGSTDFATHCSAMLVAWSDLSFAAWSVLGSLYPLKFCPQHCRTWRSSRMVGLNCCPASAVSCFCVLLQESQLVIELVLQALGRLNFSSTPFLLFPVLAKWQRVSGLLVQFRQSACKTLQSTRFSTGSCDWFHTLEIVEEWFWTGFLCSFLKRCFVWWCSRCACDSPWRAPRLSTLVDYEARNCQCVESLSLFNFRVKSVGTAEKVPQSQQTIHSAQYLKQ